MFLFLDGEVNDMGKYANLFSGIFVFSMGYFLDSMYNSVITSLGSPELVIPLDQIIVYVRYFFLGLGVLLMALGLIGIAISLIKKTLSKEEKDEEKRSEDYERRREKPRERAEPDIGGERKGGRPVTREPERYGRRPYDEREFVEDEKSRRKEERYREERDYR